MNRRPPLPVARVFCLALTVLCGRPAAAQQSRDLSIRVVVVDTAKRAMAGVDLTIVRGLHQQLAAGPTDSTGRAGVPGAHDTGAYQVVARRLGYERPVHFFAKAFGDSIGIQLEMRRTVQ